MKPLHRKILWKVYSFILATVFVYQLFFYISKFYDEEKEAYIFGNPQSHREVSSTDSNNFNSKEYESSPSFPLNYMQKCLASKAKLNKKKFRSQRWKMLYSIVIYLKGEQVVFSWKLVGLMVCNSQTLGILSKVSAGEEYWLKDFLRVLKKWRKIDRLL